MQIESKHGYHPVTNRRYPRKDSPSWLIQQQNILFTWMLWGYYDMFWLFPSRCYFTHDSVNKWFIRHDASRPRLPSTLRANFDVVYHFLIPISWWVNKAWNDKTKDCESTYWLSFSAPPFCTKAAGWKAPRSVNNKLKHGYHFCASLERALDWYRADLQFLQSSHECRIKG